MLKTDIVNSLSKEFTFRSYLEICTPTTGASYSTIDGDQLVNRQRLMYRCFEGFDDGLDCDFRTACGSSHELVQAIFHARGGVPGYDIIFVDPFHTYEASMTDLLGAYCLLRPGGALVVHDCCPPEAAIAVPEPIPQGSWCGVTYQAFIDFTLPRRHLHSYTVDCDFGCGVVIKPEGASPAADLQELEWFLLRNNHDMRFKYFENHRKALLRLIDAEQFAGRVDPSRVPPAKITESCL